MGGDKQGKGAPVPVEFSKRTFVEHQKQLREQRLLLSKLRKENMALREDMVAASSQQQTGTGLASSQLMLVSKLSEEAELYVSKIEQERRKAAELDKRCKDFSKRILEGKASSDSLDKFLRDAKQIQKTLENRLHSSKTKFGEFITENKNLRIAINELRFERAHFKEAYQKVESELRAVDTEIERVVSDSKGLFEERLQLLQKITEMKLVSDEEQKNYMAQCRELNAVLQAFEQSEKNMHAGKLMYDLQEHLGAMTSEQEEELQRKIVRGKWQLAKEKALGDVLRDQAVTFEDALTRIQEATGYSHMDDFVSHFIQIEEHNFHRFKYLNSLNQDIERATDEVQRLNVEMVALGEEAGSTDKTWEQVKQEAEEHVSRLEQLGEEVEHKSHALDNNVQTLAEVLTRLAKKMNCHLDLEDLMPHESTEVSENNLLKWLGAIEARTSELMALSAAQQARIATDDFDRPHVSLGPQKMGKTTICSIDASPPNTAVGTRAMIRPPSIKDEDIGHDDDAELDTPLGEAVLRARVEGGADSLVMHHLTWLEPRAHSAGPKDKKITQAAVDPRGSGFTGMTKRVNILTRPNDLGTDQRRPR